MRQSLDEGFSSIQKLRVSNFPFEVQISENFGNCGGRGGARSYLNPSTLHKNTSPEAPGITRTQNINLDLSKI